PDGLFQIGRFAAGGVRLGGRLRGEQRTQGGDEVVRRVTDDAAVPGGVARDGRTSPRRGGHRSAVDEVLPGEDPGVRLVGEDTVDAGGEVGAVGAEDVSV